MKEVLRIYILIVGVIICQIPGVAQKIKFKDIYPVVEKGNIRESIPLLQEYLMYDYDHPAANLQLALLLEKRYLQFDPLTELGAGMSNAGQAQLRYTKARVIVTERDVKRNTEDYANFAMEFKKNGKPILEFDTVSRKIDHGYSLAALYIEKTPVIQAHFSTAVSFYDKATKRFRKIVGQYKSLKDIYLFYDDTMEKDFLRLKSDYDSALFYFSKYQAELKDYPFRKRDQKLTVRDIVTYRLDGIVNQTDFLLNEIPVWDYSKWVDQVRKVVDTEIKNLRKEIADSHSKIVASAENIQRKKPTKETEEKILEPFDATLVLKIRKYDITSVTASLFKYEQEKLTVLNDTWRINEVDDAENISPENKLQFYSRSFNRVNQAEQALTQLHTLNDDYHLNKYKDFFVSKYNGPSGFTSYLSNEQNFIRSKEDALANIIFRNLMTISETPEDKQYASWNKNQIPLFVADTGGITVNAFVTTQKKAALDGSIYVSGYQQMADESTKGFVARVLNKKVIWLKYIEIKGDDNSMALNRYVGDLLLTQTGCIVAVHSFWPQLMAARNSIVFFSENGEQSNFWTFELAQFPRKLIYNDITGRYTLVVKGDFKDEDTDMVEKLAIHQFDNDGYEMWNYEEDLIGKLIEPVAVPSGLVVACNVSIMRNDQGEVVDFGDSPGLFVFKIDAVGKPESRKLMKPDEPYQKTKMYKISDDFITIADMAKNPETPQLILFNSSLVMKYGKVEEE